MTNRQVLLIIAAFVAVTLGMFIWYVATWDGDARGYRASTQTAPSFILAEKLQPEAPALAKGSLL